MDQPEMLHYSFLCCLSYACSVTSDSNYQSLLYHCGVVDWGGTQEVKMPFSDFIKEARGPQLHCGVLTDLCRL